MFIVSRKIIPKPCYEMIKSVLKCLILMRFNFQITIREKIRLDQVVHQHTDDLDLKLMFNVYSMIIKFIDSWTFYISFYLWLNIKYYICKIKFLFNMSSYISISLRTNLIKCLLYGPEILRLFCFILSLVFCSLKVISSSFPPIRQDTLYTGSPDSG